MAFLSFRNVMLVPVVWASHALNCGGERRISQLLLQPVRPLCPTSTSRLTEQQSKESKTHTTTNSCFNSPCSTKLLAVSEPPFRHRCYLQSRKRTLFAGALRLSGKPLRSLGSAQRIGDSGRFLRARRLRRCHLHTHGAVRQAQMPVPSSYI
jgi:hypothetical protein